MAKEMWTRRTVVGLGAFLALTALLLMPRAIAFDNATVNVTAAVVGTCKFVAPGTATLDFGTLDPSVGNDVSTTTTLQFWCTKGANYTITDDDGLYETGANQNRMRHATDNTEFIPYSFSYSPATGTGNGPQNPITLDISGTVAGADYTNALVGPYSDEVTMTISP